MNAGRRPFVRPVVRFRQSVASRFSAAAAAPRVRFNATEATLEEPIMLDRLFLPALTFTLLAAALAAFAADMAQGSVTQAPVVQLERVVVIAQRELPATPLASADAVSPAPVVR